VIREVHSPQLTVESGPGAAPLPGRFFVSAESKVVAGVNLVSADDKEVSQQQDDGGLRLHVGRWDPPPIVLPGHLGPDPAFFCKYVIRRDFKSFVLEECVPKGVTDAFLRINVILKELEPIKGDL
jgi:hypothetical protein